ncbi:MAG: pyridoxal phosphate-dependent aminotransferase family protein [Campylobacterota bacterium]|nr:pyridoxal phosphate-dependent aminotransferase family protein [Campylobacterota bacterium]
MKYYQKELDIIKKSNRFRERKIYDENLIDLASNDYLGLASNKKLLKKAYNKVLKEKYTSPKASMLVNGYSKIHKKFEQKLCKLNKFESGIVIGSGFLANVALIESLVRKKDVLFIDEDYHASGILATKLTQGLVVVFKHNDLEDLEDKIEKYKNTNRIIIAIEGVYSMGGDIAPKEFNTIANKYNAILLVDEAHSSGVIGKNLLGWFDYHNIEPKPNHIKMGTLGKAYGSYGAYILSSKNIITFLENRAKAIIYTTAPSLFDIALGHENLKYIIKHKKKINKKIKSYQEIIDKNLGIEVNSLIVPITINDNKKVLEIQKQLLNYGYIVGAIRQPTVSKAIIRLILKLDIKKNNIKKVIKKIKGLKHG